MIATANKPEVLDAAIRHRPGRFDVPVRFSNPAFPQRDEFLKRLLGTPDEHSVDVLTATHVANECTGMSMAFIKLVYETAAARAFKKRRDIHITTEDLLGGFKQAKGYYTQMETPEDRSAGFVAEKRGCEDKDEVSKNLTGENLVTGEPKDVFQPTRVCQPTRLTDDDKPVTETPS